ncbi:MAG: hypothetical protein WA913_17265 [Pricia sp.]
MRTVTVDILNEKAMNFLKELEMLQLLRLRRGDSGENKNIDWARYKGAMTKQPLGDVNDQLESLRGEWE